MVDLKRTCLVVLTVLGMCAAISSGVRAQEQNFAKELEQIIVPVAAAEALSLAEKYYKMAYPKIEPDLLSEYMRLVPTPPVFDAIASPSALTPVHSADVAVAVSYTNAKNFYLAIACAAFAADPQNLDASTNLATAIATYYDDLFYEHRGSSVKEKEFYQDAFKMYSYALAPGLRDAQHLKEGLSAVSSLGGLLMDMNRPEAAFSAFTLALRIDESFWPARKGLYNYYMAKKQFDRALELIAKNPQFYPSVARAVARVSENAKQTTAEKGFDGETPSDAAYEEKMERLNRVGAVTAADFIEAFDPRAAQKMRREIENMQSKILYKAPDIGFLTDFSSFQAAWSPRGQGAYRALQQGFGKLHKDTVAHETEVNIKKQFAMLEQFGVKIDPGFDVDNLAEMINDAMKNPEKYENYDPQVNISGLGGLEDEVQDYAKRMQREIPKAIKKGGSAENVYAEMAKSRPEYKIMLINPYQFANANDLLIQRYNVLMLGDKRGTYDAYLKGKNITAGNAITEIYEAYKSRIYPIAIEFERKQYEIASSDRSEEEKKVLLHRLHTQYYNSLNRIGEPYWYQATQIACVAYKKIEKYSARMYNDCMKHIMLISDPEIRDRLEGELRELTLSAVKNGISNVLTAYGLAPYKNPAACECDDEEIEALRRKLEMETKQAANEQIQKQIKAKKNFDEGILDENSRYYKEFIKKYEWEYNFIVLKGKVSPYKSYEEFNLDAFGTGINMKSITNHIRNTTTYDGGLSAGFDRGPVGGKTYIQFTAAKDSNGKFSVTDTTWGAAANAGIGPAGASAALEVSAVRGYRVCTQAAVTGDAYLDKLKVEVAGNTVWKPDINATMWNYDYATDWSNAPGANP